MIRRTVRRFVDDLLAGRPIQRGRPDDLDAEEMQIAVELRASRPGGGTPSEEFVTRLHRQLADDKSSKRPGWLPTRREAIVGASAAAAAVAATVVVDSALTSNTSGNTEQAEINPESGTWQAVAASTDLGEGQTMPFNVGSVAGFVRRVDGEAVALSGICTHQGCKLWLDAPDQQLRCPCHRTSFALDGKVKTHQLPVAPPPLPRLRTRESDGTVEVFAPVEPA
ncbi:Rieske (2Fe-2S) protein [Smaragdicoccus niigatensis]|uniref:Rieske (2Fe-2S) protein n=1 Tax=Smaragdicoccus niigatensis TaxID=359359 RepID=UPI00037CB1BA|nr:Rieske (2Fe-2S) protein [Smaragdicoccus niigatensis]